MYAASSASLPQCHSWHIYVITFFTLNLTYFDIRQRLYDWWLVWLWHAGHVWCMLYAGNVCSQLSEFATVPFLAYLCNHFLHSQAHLCRYTAETQWLVTSLSLTRWAYVVHVVCRQCRQSAWRDCHGAISGISNHFLHSQAHLCRCTAETCWLVTSLSLTRWAYVMSVVCTQCMQSAWQDCHSAIPGISNHFLHSQAHLCRYTAETRWLVTSLVSDTLGMCGACCMHAMYAVSLARLSRCHSWHI